MEKMFESKNKCICDKTFVQAQKFSNSGGEKGKIWPCHIRSVISVVSKVGHISRGPMFPGKIGPAQILCLSMLHAKFPLSGLCRIMQ